MLNVAIVANISYFSQSLGIVHRAKGIVNKQTKKQKVISYFSQSLGIVHRAKGIVNKQTKKQKVI